jgi:hypothetical protein
LHRDLAAIGELLGVLRDRRVPVLWRPLHEFSGDWFWWGKHGPEAFKALWALMYDTFTRRLGLDNLIWILGWAGQNIDPAWYPGRDQVDVAGRTSMSTITAIWPRCLARSKPLSATACRSACTKTDPFPIRRCWDPTPTGCGS